MADNRTIQVVVVTPDRAVLDESAESAVLPVFDGELGVLPNRAPLTARLGPGELRLTGGSGRRFFIDGGFAQVARGADGRTVVTVLTGRAVPAAELTPAKAQEAEQQAAALPTATQVERDNRYRALERARGMARVAGRG